ncbi:MAG: hypothetical protein EOM08_11455, partial [Clostridia bacterium]|nr:hypothetical protein [Clostridia bacterium]
MRNKIFVIVFVSLALVLGGFILGFRNQEEFSVLENRDLAASEPLTIANWLSTDFQQSIESVLADHFPKRNLWVKSYTRMQYQLTLLTRQALGKGPTSATVVVPDPTTPPTSPSGTSGEPVATPTPAVTIKPVETEPVEVESPYDFNSEYVDFIGVEEKQLAPNTPVTMTPVNAEVSLMQIGDDLRLARAAVDFNPDQLYVVNKNVEFFNDFANSIAPRQEMVFLIETPRLSHLVYPQSNLGTIQATLDNLQVPHDIFRIESPTDLVNNFYRTDHHWTDLGAYKGYVSLIRFLYGPDEPVLEPVNRVSFNRVALEGSLARMAALSLDIQPDPMNMLLFDYPQMEILVNGSKPEEYGNISLYLADDQPKERGYDHYNHLLQKREPFIEFDTGREDRGDILIISDSMSNPIR